ncbi:hypothetical protein FNO01nite_34660 [Flavobacterium noncentrifugens]|uniref:Uncharacterized protein n=1 Tax=Flavobacterium noncentrifugens TaxID=1128970 RepID=A0A1G9DJ44_9FLAO|nr:hypothetical protein [Flavobacterium noncentrifugens]GEP52794.1 hypothetical protein FNO01nite_34660 [Flavobacterium noncentrifugens]SDK63765.1 hypothetical protein SAMN04487935_3829 [Flavobacterium noncentrifugens]
MESNEKGKGGENFVYQLATNSFFSYWCYPNPMDELGNKKELCDLIIHFRETIILICVKNYEFKGLYSRYFRKAIEKDVRQLYGAEKKILNSTYDIQIKNINGRSHIINKSEIKNIHRIVIHLGDKVHFYPSNRETKDEKFIHVFDKTSFFNLTKFLDTIKDFEEYLEKRENTFSRKDVLILPSEEDEFDKETHDQFFELQSNKNLDKQYILISGTESDLLASYIKHERQFSEHITSDKYNGMLFQIDGTWDEFLKHEQLERKQKADKISYFIDEYVKREVMPNQDEGSVEFAKELLSFNRFERRIFSKHLFDFVKEYNDLRGFALARRYGEIDGVAIIFAFYTVDMTPDQVNHMMNLVIETYCVHTNYKHDKIILVGVTTNCKQFKFGLHKDIKPYPKELENEIRKDMELLKWFTATTELKFSEKEYPD